MKDRIAEIADLLLGAAYADQQLHGHETQAVRRLLSDVLEEGVLPGELEKRISSFKPESFDLAATAAVFKGDSAASKRRLLELVVAVHEADEELDLDEDDYVKRLAAALGLPASAYADLTLDIEIDDLRSGLESVRRGG